jgi:hypothetical protein
MAAHPLLLDSTPVFPQSNRDRYKPMQPKFASIKVFRNICLLIFISPSRSLEGQRPTIFVLSDPNTHIEDSSTHCVCFRHRESLCCSGSKRSRQWLRRGPKREGRKSLPLQSKREVRCSSRTAPERGENFAAGKGCNYSFADTWTPGATGSPKTTHCRTCGKGRS